MTIAEGMVAEQGLAFSAEAHEALREYLALRREVIPHLRTFPSLKVWVAGCADGEELYSLAILFREEGLFDRTIFYATEINRRALARAEALKKKPMRGKGVDT